MNGELDIQIVPLGKSVYSDTVSLYARGYKEYAGRVVPRVEIEQMLQAPENETFVLLANSEVLGGYTVHPTDEVQLLKAFILDRRVRKKRIGYRLFQHLREQFGDRPILMCVYADNENARRFAARRGEYCTSFIDEEAERLDCFVIGGLS